MYAVPEQIRMRFFEVRGAGGFGAEDGADAAGADSLRAGGETQRRGSEDGDSLFAGEAENLEGSGESAAQRFVDINGFFGGDHGARLFEVGASVHALDHDGIDPAAHVFDGVADFDPVGILKGRGKFLHAADAGRDVRAAAFEGRDHARAGDVTGGLWVVQDFGEGGDVGGVEADDPEAEDGFIAGAAGEQ